MAVMGGDMARGELMREFRTKNYIVRATAEEEYDLDLSWDEDGETAKALERGELIAFTAHVQVIHRPTGAVLGDDYLGNCVYKSFEDFMDHRECARYNRELEAKGEVGRCGSYFADMIHEAISEARGNYSKMELGQLHKA
jgi:hypothetical protein